VSKQHPEYEHTGRRPQTKQRVTTSWMRKHSILGKLRGDELSKGRMSDEELGKGKKRDKGLGKEERRDEELVKG